jgi:hypothetical protein
MVINKKLFQRAKKDKNSKVREKQLWRRWKRYTKRILEELLETLC